MLNNDSGCLANALALVIILILSFFVGGYCIDYSVTFWVSYIKGAPVDVPFIPCAVAGLFAGSIAIPIALFTWVLSFVI